MESGIRKRMHHFNLPGQAHELTFSCCRRYPLLSRDRTRLWLLESIDAAAIWFFTAGVRNHARACASYCPSPKRYDIAWFLKSIKQSVARKAHACLAMQSTPWFEKLTITRRDGQTIFRFWQAGGGYDRNIDRYAALHSMIEYIHNNPVRRGLVNKAGDCSWSSASWYARQACVLTIDPMP